MANVTFDITPEELRNSAQEVEAKKNEFEKTYQAIYTAAEDLNISYKGEASSTFNQRLEGYRNDFQAAVSALNRYVEFVNQYAADMDKAEAALKDAFSSLPTGN